MVVILDCHDYYSIDNFQLTITGSVIQKRIRIHYTYHRFQNNMHLPFKKFLKMSSYQIPNQDKVSILANQEPVEKFLFRTVS